jgi:hypothetical protein
MNGYKDSAHGSTTARAARVGTGDMPDLRRFLSKKRLQCAGTEVA